MSNASSFAAYKVHGKERTPQLIFTPNIHLPLYTLSLICKSTTEPTMRSFPHETLPSEQVSLSQFTSLMQQASKAGDQLDFINVALCGRVVLDKHAHRVVLNARQGLHHPHSPSFTRDFDSAIGITRNLPFTAAFNVYPVPSFKDTLTRRNHVLGPVYQNSVSTFDHLMIDSPFTYDSPPIELYQG